MVRALADRGVDNIKTVIVVTPGGGEVETLSAIVAEAEAQGVRSITHAVTVEDMLGALDAGTHVLVHTPHIGWVDKTDGAERVAAAGTPMVSILGVFTPNIGAGNGPVNARLMWNASVVVGYGTDTLVPAARIPAPSAQAPEPHLLAHRHRDDAHPQRGDRDGRGGRDRRACAGHGRRPGDARRRSVRRHRRGAGGEGRRGGVGPALGRWTWRHFCRGAVTR